MKKTIGDYILDGWYWCEDRVDWVKDKLSFLWDGFIGFDKVLWNLKDDLGKHIIFFLETCEKILYKLTEAGREIYKIFEGFLDSMQKGWK